MSVNLCETPLGRYVQIQMERMQPTAHRETRRAWNITVPDEVVKEIQLRHKKEGLGPRKLSELYGIPRKTIDNWLYSRTR